VVGRVHCGGSYVEQQLSRARRGVGHLRQVQDVGATILIEHHCAHFSSLPINQNGSTNLARVISSGR
jgi:hypothetical protein